MGVRVLDQDTPEVILRIDREAVERRRAEIEDEQKDNKMKETHTA